MLSYIIYSHSIQNPFLYFHRKFSRLSCHSSTGLNTAVQQIIMSPIAPYAKEHQDTNGPGDARPTALRIVRDQSLDDQLRGKVILVTGGTSGIGFETVRALHATGADVYFTGRDAEKGKKAEAELRYDNKPGKLEYMEMGLDSLKSIREFAADFLSRTAGKLNILVCNAGELRFVAPSPGTLHEDFLFSMY